MPASIEKQEQRLRAQIQKAFLRSGMTQAKLVEMTDWSQPEISYLLSPTSERRFTIYRMAEVANALGLRVTVQLEMVADPEPRKHRKKAKITN